MDPFTIATSVAKVTSTCLTTGKAIYDLVCKYQDAPRNLVAISSEVTVISASMSQIQAILLSKQNPEMLLRTRPEIAATLDTSLTGCMVLFSCLDEEVREVARHAGGKAGLTWKGRMKTIWKQETFQELLDGMRGQQLAINTLIQLLQMESLFEITELLQQKGPELKKTVERTESLRKSYPSVRIAESIYNQDDRMSICSTADSIMASSELEFDFDDIIVNSAAYRRVMAAARQNAAVLQSDTPDGDLISFADTDTDTLRQIPINQTSEGVLAISDDLVGLRFSTMMDDSLSVVPSIFNVQPFEDVQQVRQVAADAKERSSVTLTAQPQRMKRKPIGSARNDTSSGASIVPDSPPTSFPIDNISVALEDDISSTKAESVGSVRTADTAPSPSPGSESSLLSSRAGARSYRAGSNASNNPKLLGMVEDTIKRVILPEINQIKQDQKVGRNLRSPIHNDSAGSPRPLETALSQSLSPPPNVKRRLSDGGRSCGKCGSPLTGQFVRALGGTYHLECFSCQECGKLIAAKFFPVGDPPDQYPLCETDYFKRLDLLCHKCGQALRGSYVTALDQKYHPEHFTCSDCPFLFGAQDSYYESDGKIYCFYHYAKSGAKLCDGCCLPVMKQFVEIFRNGRNQFWHPECYMIHKYWNVRLSSIAKVKKTDDSWIDNEGHQVNADMLRPLTEATEATISHIWTVLSTFEEKVATKIFDALLAISNGDRSATLKMCTVVSAIGILFEALDAVSERKLRNSQQDISYAREAKLLCKKSVALCQLIADRHENHHRGVTQEMMSLVTGLAHYLKLLIRIGIRGSLESLDPLLEDLSVENLKRDPEFYQTQMSTFSTQRSYLCMSCGKPVEDACFRRDGHPNNQFWHEACLQCPSCSQRGAFLGEPVETTRKAVPISSCRFCTSSHVEGIYHVTQLTHFEYLLWFALAHLTSVVQLEPSELAESCIEDPKLGSTPAELAASPGQHTKESRIIDGTEGVRPSDELEMDVPTEQRTGTFQIINDTDANGEQVSQLTFGNHDSISLDDIPRILLTEQAREEQPDASREEQTNAYREEQPNASRSKWRPWRSSGVPKA